MQIKKLETSKINMYGKKITAEKRENDLIYRLEDKINELIDEVNRLNKDGIPHEHRNIGGNVLGTYNLFDVGKPKKETKE